MSVLTGRYSSSPESRIDYDIRQVDAQGIETYADSLIRGELSDAFWNTTLPQGMDTSVSSSPFFRIYEAAQVKSLDRGFLSSDITVHDLITVKSDVHHVFPKDHLKKEHLPRSQYNQIANYVVAQSEINITIGNKEPRVYFNEVIEQCRGGKRRYGNIVDLDQLRENFRMNCIPDGMEKMTVEDYPGFLKERRGLMAQKMRKYFESL